MNAATSSPLVLGHPDIREDDLGPIALGARDRPLAVANRDHLHVFIRDPELDDALDRDAVVSEQQLVGHGCMIP
jgi:hypothetical protein